MDGPQQTTRTIATTCWECNTHCGALVTVEDGLVTAQVAVGSAQVIAHADDVQSTPIVIHISMVIASFRLGSRQPSSRSSIRSIIRRCALGAAQITPLFSSSPRPREKSSAFP